MANVIEGYAEMMDRLSLRGHEDIPAIIATITKQVAEEYHNGGEVMAVIDSLLFAIQNIDAYIRTGVYVPREGTKVVSAATLHEACKISARFVELPQHGDRDDGEPLFGDSSDLA